MNADKILEGLHGSAFGRHIFLLREVDSTNNLAKKLAGYGAVEGTIVVAETQAVGRGRLGREWVSPRGGLYFSVILRPKLRSREAVGLVFVASLAVARVLRELYDLKAETKWPNDVLVDGKKICGILSEMRMLGEAVDFVVLGVGVNANFDVKADLPESLSDIATSLETALGKKVRLEELLCVLVGRLAEIYDLFLKEGLASVLVEWKKYAGFLGHSVEVVDGTERLVGAALNVDGEGALTLELEDGSKKRIFVGDVSLTRV